MLNGVKGTAGLTLTTSGTETLNAGTYDVDDGAAYTFAALNGGLTLNGSLVLAQNTTFGAMTLGSSVTLDGSSGNCALSWGP